MLSQLVTLDVSIGRRVCVCSQTSGGRAVQESGCADEQCCCAV